LTLPLSKPYLRGQRDAALLALGFWVPSAAPSWSH
jgi:hypothetical protein